MPLPWLCWFASLSNEDACIRNRLRPAINGRFVVSITSPGPRVRRTVCVIRHWLNKDGMKTGWLYAIDLGTAGSGANDYRTAIATCQDTSVHSADLLKRCQAIWRGPRSRVLRTLINLDPTAGRMVRSDLLIRSPLAALIIAPRHHALNGHERFERPWLVVGRAGRLDAVILWGSCGRRGHAGDADGMNPRTVTHFVSLFLRTS